jgi:hypothetical protein
MKWYLTSDRLVQALAALETSRTNVVEIPQDASLEGLKIPLGCEFSSWEYDDVVKAPWQPNAGFTLADRQRFFERFDLALALFRAHAVESSDQTDFFRHWELFAQGWNGMVEAVRELENGKGCPRLRLLVLSEHSGFLLAFGEVSRAVRSLSWEVTKYEYERHQIPDEQGTLEGFEREMVASMLSHFEGVGPKLHSWTLRGI